MSSNKDSIDPTFDADHTAPHGSPPVPIEDVAAAVVDHDQTVAHGSAAPPRMAGGVPESAGTLVSPAERTASAEESAHIEPAVPAVAQQLASEQDAELEAWNISDTSSPDSIEAAWGSGGPPAHPQKRHHTRSSAILLLSTSAALLLGLALFYVAWTPQPH